MGALIFCLIFIGFVLWYCRDIVIAHWHYVGHPRGVYHCARCPFHYPECDHA